jgi:hypothetical protein
MCIKAPPVGMPENSTVVDADAGELRDGEIVPNSLFCQTADDAWRPGLRSLAAPKGWREVRRLQRVGLAHDL